MSGIPRWSELTRTLGRAAAVAAIAAGATVATTAPAAAQGSTLVEIRNLSAHELRVDGFVLNESQEVSVEAVGADGRFRQPGKWRTWGKKNDRDDRDDDDDDRDDDHGVSGELDYWRGNAWILDARTRRVVWELAETRAERGKDGLRSYDGSVRLPAGTYEVYYSSYSVPFSGQGVFDWISGKDKDDSKRQYDDDGFSEEFKLTVRGQGRHLDKSDIARAREEFTRTAVVSLTGVGQESSKKIGFEITRPTEVEIYALGEARDQSAFDYGWIINTETRQRVWTLDYDRSDPAGGADKNREARVVKTLQPGKYAAFYVTDDSHDPGDWNAGPPHDPSFWGLTVRVTNPRDKDDVRSFAYSNLPPGNAIVALTGVHDSETREKGFTLNRPMDVRVYALGEGRDGRMFDYGWITNESTHRKVWTMDFDETEHAGGDAKNRLVDDVLHLEAGSYMVHYITDDSHSYEDWNAAAPIDGEMWGISLYPAKGGAVESGAVSAFVERPDPDVIARISKVRDDEDERVRFSLDRDADVRVFAVGEGTGGEMYDFAWIENAKTGRTVWEMTYRKTTHAGGASKNRQFDDTVSLPAGDYILHYETDGSHSYGSWNDAPPDDPTAWGVTIFRKR
ncbi:MAG TPA: hypothetical protein VKA84_20630 [Gemmatimonadaceae bacterium]|nr:hypothetical protein [Gemmatimonadaceae bacterium]